MSSLPTGPFGFAARRSTSATGPREEELTVGQFLQRRLRLDVRRPGDHGRHRLRRSTTSPRS